MPNFNQEDPAKGEAIRRKSHVYVLGEGRHGTYVEKPYLHQEFPKVMDKTPAPVKKDFKGKPDAELLYDNAMKEWDELQRTSLVQNRAEEEAWLELHANDPVVAIVDRQFPKTMDRTPAPLPKDYDNLQDFRDAREVHKKQIAASIVHDKEEEELWIREHQPTNRDVNHPQRAVAESAVQDNRAAKTKTAKRKSRAA